MNNKIIWLSAIALSMSINQVSFAETHHYHYMTSERYEKLTQKLDLSPEQKTKINSIVSTTKASLKSKYKDMRGIQKQLNELADSNKMDESKVNALINKKKELVGETSKLRITSRHEIYSILTEPQRAKLSAMIAKWKAEHMKKH